jgi:hypothetical protein
LTVLFTDSLTVASNETIIDLTHITGQTKTPSNDHSSPRLAEKRHEMRPVWPSESIVQWFALNTSRNVEDDTVV